MMYLYFHRGTYIIYKYLPSTIYYISHRNKLTITNQSIFYHHTSHTIVMQTFPRIKSQKWFLRMSTYRPGPPCVFKKPSHSWKHANAPPPSPFFSKNHIKYLKYFFKSSVIGSYQICHGQRTARTATTTAKEFHIVSYLQFPQCDGESESQWG